MCFLKYETPEIITKPIEFDQNWKAQNEGAREERNDEDNEVGQIKGGRSTSTTTPTIYDSQDALLTEAFACPNLLCSNMSISGGLYRAPR